LLATELEGLLNAHAFLRVERPPELWAPQAELEPFIRLLGEMIAAALARNGQKLEEVTLNVSNVRVEPKAAGPIPEGDFVALTVRSEGDWSPEGTWHPGEDPEEASLVSGDLLSAAVVAGCSYGYTRVLGAEEGSVTVFFRRAVRPTLAFSEREL
jgi:hypothetical protein